MRNSTRTSGQDDSLFEVDASVTGTFHDRDAVNEAVRALTAKSVPVHSIRVFVVDRDGKRRREVAVEDEAGVLRGAIIGLGVGAAVGVGIVLLVSTGFFGPTSTGFFGFTDLVGALRAIAICAVAGLPLGAILGMGHWQGRKKISEQDVSSGEVQVVVESEALAELARDVLTRAGATRVE